MTTASWAFSIDHQTDASFRAWGGDFHAKLAAVGLVQTADTGQINWATVTRPGTNTDGGYSVWEFDDSLQGSAPVFIRFDFGTGSNASRPSIKITVGTGSNGSGTITGTALAPISSISGVTGTATGALSVSSYMCHTEGFFGFVWGADLPTTGLAMAAASLSRSVDVNGDPDTTGLLIMQHNRAGSVTADCYNRTLRFASTAYTFGETNLVQSITVPGAETASLVGSDLQAYLAFGHFPRLLPVIGVCGLYLSEFAFTSTASIALVGATAHTYISMARQAGEAANANAPALIGLCMLWE
jgi:hypothetical protein